ncbi:3,4-dihydroxy-2-butanone-4-phosphate synthase [Pseudoxanthobacter sp.]|uniref:3,4-dihydroxy-2-butanone-4-phosphate synthase n=1 Tax=Pseudoxanthobacter sp. TaxID=1925742 RepID=UPI002FE10A38
MELDRIEAAVQAFAEGELVVVVDDTDRENEGDLILAAATATPEKIAFMIRHTSGILCVPMNGERAAELNLAPMVAQNLDPMRTAFTVTVDYKVGMTTGISAEERCNTARALANRNCIASDFLRPGHIFPLIAKPGGVLTRSGHTEAGVDLARLAGLEPLAVLSEIVNDDGTVKRLPQLVPFAREHGLRIISIEDLIAYRLRTEKLVHRVSERAMSIGGLPAQVFVYRSPFEPLEHLVAVFGDVKDAEKVPCRIHREQPLADVFGAGAGRGWAEPAMARIRAERRGVLIYLREAQAETADHEQAEPGRDGEKHSSALARMNRWREIGAGAQILRDLGVRSISVIASSERQYVGLGGFGIEIAETILTEA